MPKAAPTPCRHPGCPALVHDKTGYCEAHAKYRHGWERHHQGRTAAQRGYGNEWRKLRAQILRRDGHLCQICLSIGSYTKATEVDHITPKAMGGDDSPSNLQAICRDCHRLKTAAEGSRGDRGA